MKIVKQSAKLLHVAASPERLIEAAGRTCYRSDARGDPGAFVARLIERGHESVIEHACATVHLVTDRGVSHELVRHRLASYSQESTRWCGYDGERFGNEITVIEPPGLTASQREGWRSTSKVCESWYLELRRTGAPPEIARSVLPTCLKTEIVVTANFCEWRHIFRLRLAPAAHPQMRELMRMVHGLLLPYSEACFGEFSELARI